MLQMGFFGLLGNTHILVYYPITSSQNIEVYKFDTMDMGKITLAHWCQWNMQMQTYP